MHSFGIAGPLAIVPKTGYDFNMSNDYYTTIRERLSTVIPLEDAAPGGEGRRPSAVAMILRCRERGPECLFIERARFPGDPWSGNIGFPGGGYEESDHSLRHTAERETFEEIGVDLSHGHYLGRLGDIVGANLPVRVSCFVYGFELELLPHASEEVQDLFWIPLELLTDPAYHQQSEVRFGSIRRSVPAIDFRLPGKPVLWGITYRLVAQFCQRVSPELAPALPFVMSGHETVQSPLMP